jgi:hypothetical protein
MATEEGPDPQPRPGHGGHGQCAAVHVAGGGWLGGATRGRAAEEGPDRHPSPATAGTGNARQCTSWADK